MTVRVAVVDPLPMYARGLATALRDRGFPADTPADPAGWDLILLTVTGEPDWPHVTGLSTTALVVVVADRIDVDVWVRAVSAGATGVLARDAAEEEVLATVRAAVDGRGVVPLGVLRSLVADRPGHPPDRPLTDDEIGWLRRLAEGATVARLAESAGYSERMMFRLLAGVYARLGTDNRTRALMRARDEGWL
jgi:DNA-binding NarL/FixJ family response regulator